MASTTENTKNKFKLVHFSTEDGAKIEAAYFEASKDKIVIFAHGAIFNKESWYFLAEEFQKKGISALPIDFRGYGKSTSGSTENKYYDILGAIAYAEAQGFTDINIVGASMGGAAVLAALSKSETPVQKVVLLAPAGGSAITSQKIKKLFVVSKKEGFYKTVLQIYSESAEPKTLKEFEGSAHAQHIFKTDNSEELQELILDFIISEK